MGEDEDEEVGVVIGVKEEKMGGGRRCKEKGEKVR